MKRNFDPQSTLIEEPRYVREFLPFDWRKLTELGISLEDARKIAQNLVLKKMMLCYWRKLRRVGIPADDARRLARAIVKFDALRQSPSRNQQCLISKYCSQVCRVGLWRSNLLLS